MGCQHGDAEKSLEPEDAIVGRGIGEIAKLMPTVSTESSGNSGCSPLTAIVQMVIYFYCFSLFFPAIISWRNDHG